MATTNIVKQSASEVTLLTTELDNKANGSLALSSVNGTSGVFNNLNGGGTTNLNGYGRGVFTLTLAATGNTISNPGAVWVYFIRSTDGGSTFEDSSTQPPRQADVIFYPKGVNTAQVLKQIAIVPAGYFKVLILPMNLGSAGASAQFGSSGNTLKVLTETDGTV